MKGKPMTPPFPDLGHRIQNKSKIERELEQKQYGNKTIRQWDNRTIIREEREQFGSIKELEIEGKEEK